MDSDKTGPFGSSELDELRAVYNEALNLIRDRNELYKNSWKEQDLKHLKKTLKDKLELLLKYLDASNKPPEFRELQLDIINYLTMVLRRESED